jgi:hypothetical protein
MFIVSRRFKGPSASLTTSLESLVIAIVGLRTVDIYALVLESWTTAKPTLHSKQVIPLWPLILIKTISKTYWKILMVLQAYSSKNVSPIWTPRCIRKTIISFLICKDSISLHLHISLSYLLTVTITIWQLSKIFQWLKVMLDA